MNDVDHVTVTLFNICGPFWLFISLSLLLRHIGLLVGTFVLCSTCLILGERGSSKIQETQSFEFVGYVFKDRASTVVVFAFDVEIRICIF